MGCVLGVRQTRSTLDEMNTEQLGLCQNEVITMGWAAISKGAYGMRWKRSTEDAVETEYLGWSQG